MRRETPIDWDSEVRRKIRVILLVNGAARAGLVPLSVMKLHLLAYFSNVLAPVWDMPPLDGKLLKRLGGPFYPDLQHDVDRLVAIGMLGVKDVRHVQDASSSWMLDARYEMQWERAQPILKEIEKQKPFRREREFISELAIALSSLPLDSLTTAVNSDATYGDPLVDTNNVVDFAEWKETNYSANVANYFNFVVPDEITPTAGEKIHLYVRHLYRRLQGEK